MAKTGSYKKHERHRGRRQLSAVIVCGSRHWKDAAAVHEALTNWTPQVVIHGDATGADRLSDEWAEASGASVVPMPADWQKWKLGAGPRRNAQMLSVLTTLRDVGYDVAVLAFPLADSRGTVHMMNIAKRSGIRVLDCGQNSSRGRRGQRSFERSAPLTNSWRDENKHWLRDSDPSSESTLTHDPFADKLEKGGGKR